MNFRFFISSRYFLKKSKNNTVNIISLVSLVGVVVGTASLILVLSVFNGFEKLVLDMYNVFDPHLKISLKKGKTFSPEDLMKTIKFNKGIESCSYVLEEKALVKYQKKEYIATIKGVDNNYLRQINMDSLLIDGIITADFQNNYTAIIGSGIAYHLSLDLENSFQNLQVFLPNRKVKNLHIGNKAFTTSSIMPSAVFNIQPEIDNKYIVVPISFLQNLTGRNLEVSSLEIKLEDIDNLFEIQKKLKNQLPSDFLIQNRYENQSLLYKILNTEKLAVFLVLFFIMLIATFNIASSMAMVIIDKRNDIITLQNIGCKTIDIKLIFFYNSMLKVFSGMILGLILGAAMVFLQSNFGLVKMGDNFIVEAYPVLFSFFDVTIVLIIIVFLGAIFSWYSTSILNKRFNQNLH